MSHASITEKKTQAPAPNVTFPHQHQLLTKSTPGEHGIASHGARRTFARTRRAYLGEAVVISLPVASHGKPPGLGAGGRHVGDLKGRARMREGGDRRAQGSPAKPGLTLALPHTQRLPARDGHGVQTPPVSHRGVTMEIQNLNLQGKKKNAERCSIPPRLKVGAPSLTPSLTPSSPSHGPGPPLTAPGPQRQRAPGKIQLSWPLSVRSPLPPAAGGGGEAPAPAAWQRAAGRAGNSPCLPAAPGGRAARPSAAPAPPRRHVAPPPAQGGAAQEAARAAATKAAGGDQAPPLPADPGRSRRRGRRKGLPLPARA